MSMTFGVVPQQSTDKLADHWHPLLSAITEETGIQLKFATAKNIPAFEHRLANGDFYLAYMSPYHYVIFHQSSGYQALVHQTERKLKGVIVVHKDSQIANLEQLESQQIAFPAPSAFAASILIRAKLRETSVGFGQNYVESHDAVYLSVAKGLFTAGGGVERTFANAPAKVREALKIIWRSPGYTPHAIATHPKVSAATRALLLAAFLNLHTSDLGQASLKMLKIKGFQAAEDSDWDQVRALNLHSMNDPKD